MSWKFNPFTGSLDYYEPGVPTLSIGSVPFSNGSVLTEDNTALHWDATDDRLSLFSSLSAEKVTNGSFTGSGTGWTFGSGWAYSSNTAAKNSNGTGVLQQNVGLTINAVYQVSFTVTGYTTGSFDVSIGGVTLVTGVSANGTYTYRFKATSTANINFTPTNTSRFSIDDVSVKQIINGGLSSGNVWISGNGSSGGEIWIIAAGSGKGNGSPGTTQHMTFENGGQYTWTNYRFGGTLRAAIGANSSGGVDFYGSGGNYFAFYYGNSGLTSNTLFAYLYPTAFIHSAGYGAFNQGVMAGSVSNPTSTLQTYGSFSARVERKTANFTADSNASVYLVDASTPACSGTPSFACSHWSNQADCEKWDAHGGCTWFAGNSCSVYDNEAGMSTCSGTSGCTAVTTSCGGAGDESSCLSQDDAYGGSCAWTLGSNTCPSYTNTSDCNNNSPCYANLGGDCTALSDGGGDGSMCATQPECSYDSGTGACTGNYFTSCDGDNATYSCTGSYYTGSCTGTYGAACTGTPTCSGIDDSTNCGNETGCTWATAATASLPQITTCPGRQYWFYNLSSSNADAILQPYSGDTVDHTTTYTLSNYKDWVHITGFADLRNCDGLNESTCGSTSGCTQVYSNCSWNVGDSTCSGHTSCTGYGDQSSCEAATYYSGCSGNYYASKNWYVIGR